MSQAAAAVDAPVDQRPAEGVGGPALPDLDHVDVAVEMHARPRARALAAGDEVPARVPVAVAGRALGAHELGPEAERLQPARDELADLAVVLARRVDGRDAHQRLGQRDQRLAPRPDRRAQRLAKVGHGFASLRRPAFPRGGALSSAGPARQARRGAHRAIYKRNRNLRHCCTAAGNCPRSGGGALTGARRAANTPPVVESGVESFP